MLNNTPDGFMRVGIVWYRLIGPSAEDQKNAIPLWLVPCDAPKDGETLDVVLGTGPYIVSPGHNPFRDRDPHTKD